jgi:hypothetical protein
VPATSQIPQAVKDIYSKLAHAANEPDQGIPQLLLSLIGSGNVFSNEVVDFLRLKSNIFRLLITYLKALNVLLDDVDYGSYLLENSPIR